MVSIATTVIVLLANCALIFGGLPVYHPDASKYLANCCAVKICWEDVEGYEYQQFLEHMTAYVDFRSKLGNLPKDFKHKYDSALDVLLRIKLTDMGDTNEDLNIPERKGNITIVDCKLIGNDFDEYPAKPVDAFVYKHSETEFEDTEHMSPLAKLIAVVERIGNETTVRSELSKFLGDKVGRVLTSCIVFDGEYKGIELGAYLFFGCVVDISKQQN